jgi:hypothetical protein
MIEPGTTVRVSSWVDIERAIPSKEYEDLWVHHFTLLEDRRAARAAMAMIVYASELDDQDPEVFSDCRLTLATAAQALLNSMG